MEDRSADKQTSEGSGKCHLIPFESEMGRKLLDEAKFTDLVSHFCKQISLTYCGICSVAIVCNGILQNLDSTSEFKKEIDKFIREQNTENFNEDSVLEFKGVKGVLSLEELKTEGVTLEQLGKVVAAMGLKSTLYFANNETLTSSDGKARNDCHKEVKNVDELRSILLEAMQKPSHYVVVNYLMSVLGFTECFGHFSPLGGYHLEGDRFLVLDVWPYTPVAWVKAEDLFTALTYVDSQSGKTRGFCVICVNE